MKSRGGAAMGGKSPILKGPGMGGVQRPFYGSGQGSKNAARWSSAPQRGGIPYGLFRAGKGISGWWWRDCPKFKSMNVQPIGVESSKSLRGQNNLLCTGN